MEDIKKVYRSIKRRLDNLSRTIRYIHKVSGKLRIVLFFDILWCFLIYGTTDNEYRIFEFYEIKHNKRKTYMSKRKYKMVNKKLVDKDISNIINNKEVFNLRFNKYLNRDVININSMSFKEFEEYALENKNIVATSNSSNYLLSYSEYNVADFRSPAFMEDRIRRDNLTYVEEKINQINALDEINDYVIVNVVSVYNKKPEIVSSTIKYKSDIGIISGFIDVNKGTIKGNLRDEYGNKVTNEYNGLVIPKFGEVLKITKELSKELEEVRQLEWSFLIGSRKVYLLGANIWDDYVFTQISEYLNDRNGLMTYYNKIL